MTDLSVNRRIIVCAGISGALGVLLGSFGAHGLEDWLGSRGLDEELVAKRLDQFDVAVRYHLIHTVGLLAISTIPMGTTSCRCWVSCLFLLGLILFSGSLYALVLTNQPMLGAITPLGGLSWIAGWLLLPFLARRNASE